MKALKTFSQALVMASAVVAFAPVYALEAPVTQTAMTQSALSPADALAMLKAGNDRFVSGGMLQRDLPGQVSATAAGQYPHSIVLGCIDSRVPPELVFDQGLGDIFSPRIAGNVVTPELLGSMEFAAAVAGSKVIVVLGHTECGAVKGACDGVEMGNLTSNLAHIIPAVEAVPTATGPRDSSNTAWVTDVAKMNVSLTVAKILSDSPVLKGLVDEGKLSVVGGMYDVSTGKVAFLD
ncbi:MAG: carbonic anhydrase family protein [Haliea sp.]|jgi:carbonic anhydrase|nr:carbonic anhydrase family protein [Haliea sp.]MDP4788890.1 carbonic anhydrase family protein [Haliea sp.]MDP4916589.1 carbonic anhydrase family protein [Haliea sp.]MDP5064677.1 carbonic anhydrase family protein [Haliea sp.]